jgi:folate-binding protein YgfZ
VPHLERFRVMEEVEFHDASREVSILGLAGPAAGGLLGPGTMSPGTVGIGADPLSVLVIPSRSRGDFPLADFAVFEPWRIAKGLPLTGIDFDMERIATELDDPGAISLTKGCYVGQEVVARTSNRGQVRRRRFGFRFEGALGLLPPRSEIRTAEGPAGFVTSSALEPGTGEGIGMGYAATEALATGSDLLVVQRTVTIRLRQSP